MYNLFLISSHYLGFYPLFLSIIVIVSIFSGILTIVSKNPIVSVLYLILLFSGVSCYLIFLDIKFIGISYLLVYVGAVSILFLFILMLINIRVSELTNDTSNSIPLSILSVTAFIVPLTKTLPSNNDSYSSKVNYVSSNN
jgi:NADH-ubiquinone oxidoreductase chain 6